jgi:hypothetical protein
MRDYKYFLLTVLSITALSACESAQEQLGLNKAPPDEFQVVKRAPLEMPPQYTLRPPSPGAPRPQEQATMEQARQSVFGGEDGGPYTAPTSAEGALLQQAGTSEIDPNIRSRVDKESAEMVDENQPVIDKLMNLGRDTQPPAKVLDAAAEAERLQTNQTEGKPVTEGETPSIED